MRNIIVIAACIALAGCTPAQQQTASTLTPVAADALNTASPSTVTKLNAQRPAILAGLAAARAAAVAGGASASTLAQIDADITLAQSGFDNIATLAANDAKPVTATNSGNSPAWEQSLLDDAVKVAGIVLPMVL